MKPNQNLFQTNMSLIKIRFTHRFLRALKKLNHRGLTATGRRCHMVKFASYASMASAVGSRKAWSRAVLKKVRSRGLIIPSKERILKENRSRRCGFLERSEELRKLVPGGEGMDFCRLLDETAHYINCLSSQVQVMRNIVDFYSS